MAWRLGGLTVSDLWSRYMSLGGCHPQTAMAAYLGGAGARPDTEHNVLAQALDEGLWELGLPSVAPRREPEAAARGTAPGSGRPRP